MHRDKGASLGLQFGHYEHGSWSPSEDDLRHEHRAAG
jgi:hypothetical protein